MSDFGRPDASSPNKGDAARYAWLAVLGALVLLAVLAPLDGSLTIFVAVVLVLALAGGVVALLVRRRR